MFVRMVTNTIREEEVLHAAKTYERLILSALRKTGGCIFAAYMQNVENHRECVSLTIWRSQQEAYAYESSGLYLQLVNAIRPYFTESTEWKLQLNEDYALENVPIQIEPDVAVFSDPVTGADDLRRQRAKPFAIQTVTLTVQDGSLNDFERIFSTEILPVYRSTKGFIDLLLLRHEREYHSITFWDETVDITTSSDINSINLLVRSIYSVLPPFVQWRVSHRGASRSSASSEDIRATVHRTLTAEWFTQEQQEHT